MHLPPLTRKSRYRLGHCLLPHPLREQEEDLPKASVEAGGSSEEDPCVSSYDACEEDEEDLATGALQMLANSAGYEDSTTETIGRKRKKRKMRRRRQRG